MKAQRATAVLMVTIGTWMAIYFRTREVSLVNGSPKGFPKPCLIDRVRKTVETIARI